MVATKVCPLVFRDATASKIMVFRHPLAGIQLVKGSIEPGEALEAAALRELREESGIADAVVRHDLGLWDAEFEGQIWSMQVCGVARALPERWVHDCQDDGGIRLHFFWHDLAADPSVDWHPVFRRALEHISRKMKIRLPA